MKKFIIAALAASVVASPVLDAPWDNGMHTPLASLQSSRCGYDACNLPTKACSWLRLASSGAAPFAATSSSGPSYPT